jgi:hypothetical protein
MYHGKLMKGWSLKINEPSAGLLTEWKHSLQKQILHKVSMDIILL